MSLSDLTTLPSLPLDTPAEIVFLDASQPLHCDCSEWDHALRLPPWPDHANHRGDVSYFTRLNPRQMKKETYKSQERSEVVYVHLVHTYLRSLLSSNLSLLSQHGEQGLMRNESALRTFAQNHNAIHETLSPFEHSYFAYGLSSVKEAYRVSRNYFSHTFLTVKRSAIILGWHVKGKAALYSELLEQVIATEEVLRESLEEEERWEDVKTKVVVVKKETPLTYVDWWGRIQPVKMEIEEEGEGVEEAGEENEREIEEEHGCFEEYDRYKYEDCEECEEEEGEEDQPLHPDEAYESGLGDESSKGCSCVAERAAECYMASVEVTS